MTTVPTWNHTAVSETIPAPSPIATVPSLGDRIIGIVTKGHGLPLNLALFVVLAVGDRIL